MKGKFLYKKQAALLVIICTLLTSAFPAMAADYTGKVNTDKVLLRYSASSSSDYAERLAKGTTVTLLDIRGDYYKVDAGKHTGYILCTLVTVKSSVLKSFQDALANKSKYADITRISALGDAPGYLSKGDSGDDVEKFQQALKIKGYYNNMVDGSYGDKTVTAAKAYQKSAGLTVTGKADYATIKKLFGSVSETTVRDDPAMKGIDSLSDITVPATSQKGNSGSKVKLLQQALKLKGYYDAPIDSRYGDATVTAVKALQKAKGLSQDGEAGSTTIKALFGKPAANFTYKTERLDWFNGGANVIPKSATFMVKDIETGKVFKSRRWSGVNHLDAEPYTAEDTAIMKSAFGGAWSWERRAVLVLYNGHVYAGSMNGMPHGTSTIDNNNFPGQFCIHFYKSKTHETNKVDIAHQYAVARAMNAQW
jgi:peptidoglycan hydrolase-like protein with peptidoglycan-binding domain